MALPNPRPALVIFYSYLWEEEETKGREEGQKNRPCVVILVNKKAEEKPTVLVAPITHSPPEEENLKIKIPSRTALRMGLDGDESWVVISELNEFVWPGHDLRPVPGSNPPKFEFGFVPEKFFEIIKKKIITYYASGKMTVVKRT